MITDERAIRPLTLATFIGQDHFKENLATFLASARSQRKVLDHVLVYGPPGLGKTTIAQIIANELNVSCHYTLAPSLQKPTDLVQAFGKVNERDCVFVDEIHRLSTQMAEILYPMMEDFKTSIPYNKKRIIVSISPFTLIGATTRPGDLPQPLRDRFGISLRLALYPASELAAMLIAAAPGMGIALQPEGAQQIANRARGTPRIALKLLRRANDFAVVGNLGTINGPTADAALSKLGIDREGLDEADRNYIRCLAEQFGGGPAGVDAISAAMGEDRNNVEDMIEPYLIQAGIVQRTPRGRMLSEEKLAQSLPNLRIVAAD